jgi:hypothetical protein
MKVGAQPVAQPGFDAYAVFSRGTVPQVWLLPEGSGWSLPCVSFREDPDEWPGPFCRALRDRLGIEVTVLRRLATQRNEAEQRKSSLYAVETPGSGDMPPAGRWVGREALRALPLAVPEHRAPIETWLAELESGHVPALRNAWEQPGWFGEAADWMREQMAREGIAARGPVEQFRTWSISCLLRVETDAGALFLKAAPPMFAHEPRLTRALCELHPGRVPDVLATDDGRRWLLMREFRGEPLWRLPDIQRWEEALRLLASIQIESAGRVAWLFSLGCPDRRLDVLAAQIDPLIANDSVLGERGLSGEEIARLRSLAPRLKDRCAEVAAGPIPATLVHGDYHPGNIVADDAGVLIYDWTDGCIAHPFLDFVTFLRFGPFRDAPDAYERLRAVYLDAWAETAPMDDLIRLFEQAQALGALHQIISYLHITANIEAKGEMTDGVTTYVGDLLEKMAPPPARG